MIYVACIVAHRLPIPFSVDWRSESTNPRLPGSSQAWGRPVGEVHRIQQVERLRPGPRRDGQHLPCHPAGWRQGTSFADPERSVPAGSWGTRSLAGPLGPPGGWGGGGSADSQSGPSSKNSNPADSSGTEVGPSYSAALCRKRLGSAPAGLSWGSALFIHPYLFQERILQPG